MTDLSSETLKIVERVEKLLRLASNNPNEAEAASAAAKAQDLLAAYNLDMTIVGQAGGATERRDDKGMAGGLYKWQRSIWEKVAELNFCLYRSVKGLTKGSKYEHRLIGRTSNILSTRLMAEYLEGAIERITRERYDGQAARYLSRDGVAFREGMADRIGERLQERRREIEREARRKQEAERARGSTSHALTIVDVKKSEWDANQEFEYDLRHGAGAWARVQEAQRQYTADYQRRRVEAIAAAEQFKLDHPEEYDQMEADAERQREKWRKQEERNARRRRGRFSYKGWSPRSDDYYHGKDAGNSVSLDQQVGGGQNRIGRS